MKYRFLLFLIIGIDALILHSRIPHISISATEAQLLYEENFFFSYMVRCILDFFSWNDYSLRYIMIFFHLLSLLLMYEISKKYISQERNRVWLVLMFALLPGIVSSALVVSHAGFIIFGLLLFVFLESKLPKLVILFLAFIYAFLDVGFAYLFFGLAIYHLYTKNYIYSLYYIFLYFFTSYMYGFDVHGYPSGHFLDTVGVYSAIFTPIIFIYIVYALYRRYLMNKVDVIWYITTTALLFSLIISFRQRINVEHFAPYLILALPLAAQTFIHSYRVRLKEHRKGYKSIFVLSFIFLFLNTLIVFFNKELYNYLENPKQHFAYNMHVAKELSNKLKNMGIDCVTTDLNMQRRLKFYKVEKCSQYMLNELSLNSLKKPDVTISYNGTVVYEATVTKLNSN